MNSESASWSKVLHCVSASFFAAVTSSMRRRGTTSQPRRSPGARLLLVEPALTVGVVLDHDALAGSSPANRLGAPLRREDDAEGELVCRSEQHRVGFTGLTERG